MSHVLARYGSDSDLLLWKRLQKRLPCLSDEEIQAIFEEVADVCHECWNDDRDCQCWNDE